MIKLLPTVASGQGKKGKLTNILHIPNYHLDFGFVLGMRVCFWYLAKKINVFLFLFSFKLPYDYNLLFILFLSLRPNVCALQQVMGTKKYFSTCRNWYNKSICGRKA